MSHARPDHKTLIAATTPGRWRMCTRIELLACAWSAAWKSRADKGRTCAHSAPPATSDGPELVAVIVNSIGSPASTVAFVAFFFCVFPLVPAVLRRHRGQNKQKDYKQQTQPRQNSAKHA